MSRYLPRLIGITGFIIVVFVVLLFLPVWPAENRPVTPWPGESQASIDFERRMNADHHFKLNRTLANLLGGGVQNDPPWPVQRVQQKKLAAARLNIIGGYPALYKAAREHFDNHIPYRRGQWRPGEAGAKMPKALATLRPRMITIEDRKHYGADIVIVRLFGASSSGSRGIAFYGYMVVLDAAPGYIPPRPMGENTTGVVNKLTDNIYEYY